MSRDFFTVSTGNEKAGKKFTMVAYLQDLSSKGEFIKKENVIFSFFETGKNVPYYTATGSAISGTEASCEVTLGKKAIYDIEIDAGQSNVDFKEVGIFEAI
jgi:hypothetical protein